MRRRVPDEPACERCERPESYCTCPQEGDEGWCVWCGWSVIRKIEMHQYGWSAECALCGEDMTYGLSEFGVLPTDRAELRRIIGFFFRGVEDGRDFGLDLAALDAAGKPLPKSWRRTHMSDARALSSALDLLEAAAKVLDRLGVEMPR